MCKAHIMFLMKKLKNVPVKYVAIASALLLVAAGAYLNFFLYRPKVLKQVKEVRAFKTSKSIRDLPYMQGTKELGVTETLAGKQITLEVARTPEDVQSFYKNVLLEKGWEVENNIERADLIIDKYKNNDYLATITISKEKNADVTVVGINLRNR